MKTSTPGPGGAFDDLRYQAVLSKTSVCSHQFWSFNEPCKLRTCIGCGKPWCVERVPLLLGPCCIEAGIR